MIINTSHISMDASSGHKDVSRTTGGTLLSRNHSGRTEAHFRINSPLLGNKASVEQTGREHELRQAVSAVGSKEETSTNYHGKSVISRAVEALTGTTAQIRTLASSHSFANRLHTTQAADRSAGTHYYRIGGQQFSMSFSAHRVQYEYEYLDFSSSGALTTNDGRTLNFSLNLSIRRTSVVHQSVLANVATGYLVDPLVLHFGNGLETLSEHSFLFDLDGDGALERLPGLATGSGFLALDIDQDNRISTGRELFGPARGSGFADLAVHDMDHNNWIDENDPIFPQLRIWRNPGKNEQELVSLQDAGVGAISLTHAGTLFNLKSRENRVLGQVTATGIFLTEAGEVKSLQDLTVLLPDKTKKQHQAGAESTSRATDLSLEQLRAMLSAHRRHLVELARNYRLRLNHGPHEIEERWRLLTPSTPEPREKRRI